MAKQNAATASSSHVRFPDEQVEMHNAEIGIQYDGQSRVDVHLGFLQIYHIYHVSIDIKHILGETVTTDAHPDGNVSLLASTRLKTGDGHQLKISFKAYREKLLEEELVLKSVADPTKSMVLVFHARVLGKGQGTPALRLGIHCAGVDSPSSGTSQKT